MPIMTAEAELMRKKVLAARIATGVVLVGILGAFCYSQWAASDAGIVADAESKLSRDHRTANILDCLETAARLSKEGKKQPASQIESAVDRALEADSKESKSASSIYLAVARALQEKGSEDLAYKYAFDVLKAASKDAGAANAGAPKDTSNAANSLETLSNVQAAAEIILRSKKRMTKEQAEVAVQVGAKMSDAALQSGSDSLVDLALSAISNNSLPASDDAVRCLFAKDLSLAKHGQTAELEKSSAAATDVANKLQDDSSLRPAPEPCLLTHYIDLGAALQATNPAAAARYIRLAENILPGISRQQTDEVKAKVLASALCKLSAGWEMLGDKNKAIACAREAVALRSLTDATGGACTNQLISALDAANQYKEAQTIAEEAYKFYKANAKDPEMKALKADCAVNYFRALVGLNRTSVGIKLLNDELKDQIATLPGSANSAVMVSTKLADYHLKRRELKAAAACVSQIAAIGKKLPDSAAIAADMTVINYAAKTNTPELTAEACSDALDRLNKNKLTLDQKCIDGFCLALDNLRKAEANELYSQVLEKLKDGCLQLLASNMADPLSLANVVNELGTSGEPTTSDLLRSQAIEKLSESQKSVFLSHSMDFVVSGEHSNEYAEPLHAAGVYLDLAHSMQGKDNESAFKNAFEALKIYNVLGSKQPELRERLLDTIDEGAAIIIASKQTPNAEQTKVLASLCAVQEPFIRKSSKARILDVVIAAQTKADAPLTDDLITLIQLDNETLAKRALYSQLDANISKYGQPIIDHQKSGIKFASHLADVAHVLSEKKEQLAARRYLNKARRIVEEESAARATRDTEMASVAGTPSAVAVPKFTPAETAEQRNFWNRLSIAYSKVGDAPSALSCSKKSVAFGGDGKAVASLLVDRLIESRNFSDAEPLAQESYQTAKSRATTSAGISARANAARKLFIVLKEQRKDEQAVAVMREELEGRRQSPNADALQTAQLYLDLANFYASRGDNNSASACLTGVVQNKSLMTSEQQTRWERSGIQKDVINLALQLNDTKLAGQQAEELVSYKSVDKAGATKGSTKWWAASLSSLKASDQDGYRKMLDFVKAGFNAQVTRGDADGVSLGKILTELAVLGEDKIAIGLRDEALLKLPAKTREVMNANCKGLPMASNSKPSTIAEKNSSSPAEQQTQPKAEPNRDWGGRLDASGE